MTPRLVGALIAVALVASACNKVAPSKPNPIMAFGDSLTVGVGTTAGNNYVSLLAQRLSVEIVNAGRSGDTTASALSRLDSAVLSRNPRIVIVLLGGNDLLQGVPVPQRVSNITSIVQQIRAKGATVILVGLTEENQNDPFEGALPGIANQTSSTYVPGVLDGFYGDPAFMADAVHPNNAGHKIMADRIEPALKAALGAAFATYTPAPEWPSLQAHASARTKWSAPLAPAGWAKSTGRVTLSSTATLH